MEISADIFNEAAFIMQITEERNKWTRWTPQQVLSSVFDIYVQKLFIIAAAGVSSSYMSMPEKETKKAEALKALETIKTGMLDFDPRKSSNVWVKKARGRGRDLVLLQVFAERMKAFEKNGLILADTLFSFSWMVSKQKFISAFEDVIKYVSVARGVLEYKIRKNFEREEIFTQSDIRGRVKRLASHVLVWYNVFDVYMERIIDLPDLEEHRTALIEAKKKIVSPAEVRYIFQSTVEPRKAIKSFASVIDVAVQHEKHFSELCKVCEYPGFVSKKIIFYIGSELKRLSRVYSSVACGMRTLEKMTPAKRKDRV